MLSFRFRSSPRQYDPPSPPSGKAHHYRHGPRKHTYAIAMPSDHSSQRRHKHKRSRRRQTHSTTPSTALFIALCVACFAVVTIAALTGLPLLPSFLRKPSTEHINNANSTTIITPTMGNATHPVQLPFMEKLRAALRRRTVTTENKGSDSTPATAAQLLERRRKWRLGWHHRHEQVERARIRHVTHPQPSPISATAQRPPRATRPNSRSSLVRDRIGRIIEPASLSGEDEADAGHNGHFTYFHESSSSWHTVSAPSAYSSGTFSKPGGGAGPANSFRGILSTSRQALVGLASRFTTARVAPRNRGSDSDSSDSNDEGDVVRRELKARHVKEIEESPVKLMRRRGMLRRSNDFQGVPADELVGGHNVTRVSHALYKIMKLFGFSSVLDSPAGAHVPWVREFVQRMVFELPHFSYVALDAKRPAVEAVRARVADIIDAADYVVADAETLLPTRPPIDVMFHWTSLDGNARTDPRSMTDPAGYVQHVRRVMAAAKTAGIGYLIIAQLPSLKNWAPTYRHGKWVYTADNVRDVDPFLMNDYVRGAVPIAGGTNPDVLYLTFYSLRAIPMTDLRM